MIFSIFDIVSVGREKLFFSCRMKQEREGCKVLFSK